MPGEEHGLTRVAPDVDDDQERIAVRLGEELAVGAVGAVEDVNARPDVVEALREVESHPANGLEARDVDPLRPRDRLRDVREPRRARLFVDAHDRLELEIETPGEIVV